MSWQDNKPFFRIASCWGCAFGHSGETICSFPGKIIKVRCDKTHRMGKIERACYCDKFEPSWKGELYYGEDGIPIRNKTSLEYHTECQWRDYYHRRIKENAIGIEMHPTINETRVIKYYLIEETVEINY